MDWLSLGEMAPGGLAAAPGTCGEVVEKREPERQGASAGPSKRGSDGIQGKGFSLGPAGQRRRLPRDVMPAPSWGVSSPEGAQP